MPFKFATFLAIKVLFLLMGDIPKQKEVHLSEYEQDCKCITKGIHFIPKNLRDNDMIGFITVQVK